MILSLLFTLGLVFSFGITTPETSSAQETDCPELDITAEDVFDNQTDDNLKAFVKNVIAAIQEDVKNITVDETEKLAGGLDLVSLGALTDPAKQKELSGNINARIKERRSCYEEGDFKHENIYVFVMEKESSIMLVSGGNQSLEDRELQLKDYNLEGDDKTIVGLFNRELGDGTSAYAEYRWDDPLDMDDEIENWLERGLVPGTSPKRSYIEVADRDVRRHLQ